LPFSENNSLSIGRLDFKFLIRLERDKSRCAQIGKSVIGMKSGGGKQTQKQRAFDRHGSLRFILSERDILTERWYP
jgi:hypothetical protein